MRGRTHYRGAAVCAVVGLAVAIAGGCTASGRDQARPSDTSTVAGPTTPPADSGTPAASPSGGQPSTVAAPTPPAGTVRLAAVELLPEDPYPGGQLVLLVNGGSRPVDLTCWTVHSAATGRSARILTDEALPPGEYLRLLPETVLFDSGDTVSLLDARGRAVDRTPALTDRARDDQLWFRQRNGTWAFGREFHLPERVDDGRLAVGTTTC